MVNKKLGFCLTGSFCCLEKGLDVLRDVVKEGYDVYPIMSHEVYSMSSRFTCKDQYLAKVKQITNKEIIHTIQEAERFGPFEQLDIVLIYPCTSSTLSKLAYGINDNAVTMTVKSSLRNQVNIVIGLCSNDVLGNCGIQFMTLLNRKHFYFVPMYQDDYVNKPCSMLAFSDKVVSTLSHALQNKQVQPLFESL